MQTGFRLILLSALVAAACSKSEDAPPASDPPAAEEPKKKSNIERIQMAVPYGKQVACTDIFDPAGFGEAIGHQVGEMKDKGSSNREASFSCAFHLAGEPPKDNVQLKKFEKEGLKLGVLPGDEVCMVTGYCSMANEVEGLKKTCEQRGDSWNDFAVGQPSCVHQSQRGTQYAYTYRTIDPETSCLLEVMGGPSVTDEDLVQTCTRAALADVTPGELTNFR
jgi:hypothetical protein